MKRRDIAILVMALAILPLSFFGCKGKVEKPAEPPAVVAPTEETVTQTQAQPQAVQTVEPAQTVANETIPPTAAAPQVAATKAPVTQGAAQDRGKDIQKALKNAGFYSGAIDGKLGPKTKKAIEAFQKAKGLKADGRVGSKTWSELEKYLAQ